MTTITSGTPFEFSPEVKKRLGEIPMVVLDGVDENSDPFGTSPLLSHMPSGQVQAKPVPESKQEGYSEVYRNVASPNELLSAWHPTIQTAYDSFQKAAESFPDRECVGQRNWDSTINGWSKEYHWQTYEQVVRRKNDFGSGLVNIVSKHAGLTGKDRKYIVSIFGPNCINWAVADLACVNYSLPSVCLYDTLGPETSEYILNFCESPVIVTSLANISKILKLKPNLPNLKVLVSMEALTSNYGHEQPGESKKDILNTWATEAGVALYSFDDVEAIGASNPVPHDPPTRDDIYAINFTSGTTGNPKGAILTHANVVAGMTMSRFNLGVKGLEKTAFSFLPLAHIYERLILLCNLSNGTRQGYPHGPLTEILDDIAVLKPTMVPMVPRVLNRIADTLKSLTIEAPGMGGYVSRKAHTAKVDHLRKTGSPSHPVWDRLWSKKIRKAMGFENLQLLGSGSAPLSKENQEFLKVALATDLGQGYGLTESLSGVSMSQVNDLDTGSCGPIAPTCEIRLRDVPDLGYYSSDTPDPRGEIMLRGPQIFQGYYRDSDKTLEAFDEQGWFHTGDVGQIDSLGRIYIIDRVKNFFKLAQGEYVGAEKIENAYQTRCALLAQIFVQGYSTETYLVAIAGVNPETYAPWVSKLLKKKVPHTDFAAIKATFDDPKVRSTFLNALNASIENNVLQGFERVKNVRLAIEPLSMENDTLTPTLKIKRNIADKVFKNDIDEMYKEGPQEYKGKAKL